MRFLVTFAIFLTMLFCFAALAADTPTPPNEIVFESKMGSVTFHHATHVERVKNDCTTCHTALFPQSRAPINFKAGMHKPAEAAKTACAFCHRPEGMSFATTGNCNKCHVKK